MKRILSILLCAILALSMLMGTLVSCTTDEPDNNGDNENNGDTENNENNGENETAKENETKYNAALALITEGKYEEAYATFKVPIPMHYWRTGTKNLRICSRRDIPKPWWQILRFTLATETGIMRLRV